LTSKQQAGKRTDKSALGKGLKALIGPKDIDPADRIERIPVDAIRPNPKQPRRRFDEAELRDLTESLQMHGLLQPVTVTRNDDASFTLVAGERRLIAAKAAGWSEIPALVKDYDELKSLQMSLVENIQRENLNEIELAYAYLELAEMHGMTQAEIAKMVGKSRPTIANTLRLLELPDLIKEGIIMGKISAGHARALLAVSETRRENVFQKIIDRGLSVRQVERIASKDAKTAAAKAPDAVSEKDLEMLARGLEDRFHRRVHIIRGAAKGGRVIIHFRDDADLNDLLSRLAQA
jgi:ParB family chromosome partitioning protein